MLLIIIFEALGILMINSAVKGGNFLLGVGGVADIAVGAVVFKDWAGWIRKRGEDTPKVSFPAFRRMYRVAGDNWELLPCRPRYSGKKKSMEVDFSTYFALLRYRAFCRKLRKEEAELRRRINTEKLEESVIRHSACRGEDDAEEGEPGVKYISEEDINDFIIVCELSGYDYKVLRRKVRSHPGADVRDGSENRVNLCDSCTYTFPDCKAMYSEVLFGKGYDNICMCRHYVPSADIRKKGEAVPHYETRQGADGESGSLLWVGNECPFCGDRGVKSFCPNCGADLRKEQKRDEP